MICYNFPPNMRVGSLRSRKHAQYLPMHGWGCRVITACGGKDRKMRFDESVRISTVYNLDMGMFVSFLVSTFKKLSKGIKGLFRKDSSSIGGSADRKPSAGGGLGVATQINRWLLIPDPQFFWILFALPVALLKARRCDVIYSSAWPVSCHVLGLLVKKLTGKPWVADYRDEWTLNSQWKPPTVVHKKLGEKLDASCIKNADLVVNTTEKRTQRFISHFAGPQEKYITIHNGYDEDDIKAFADVKPPDDKFVITYLGSLYGGRDPEGFLSALKSCIDNDEVDRSRVCVNFIGSDSPALKKVVEALKLDDIVEISEPLSQEKAFSILSASDLALLIGSDMESYAMTTKVYEFAAMKKPILALVPQGPVKEFVEKCGGWCCENDDINQIHEYICKIYKLYKSKKLEHFSDNDFVRLYERKVLTSQLVEHLNKLT